MTAPATSSGNPRLAAIRPATEKLQPGLELLRRAVLEGGVSVWTPFARIPSTSNLARQRGVWTNITLLGDVTTYVSPGLPNVLLEQHRDKVRKAVNRMGRSMMTAMTLFAMARWGTLLYAAGNIGHTVYLSNGEAALAAYLQPELLAWPIGEALRLAASKWIGGWLR